ncbi:gluconate 2-dehydrogenase subunit 3 family protein [Muricauda sp. JGD-17]|uniref:Gluconate 2-dehydrogenase subunit 3 family protein n=1 Tax=Flagellimonas ochracea TaxID=2696472 RepID=A0A964WYP2_9FLAO|nr:gluconate 2-dehydrogenase subunit 3 family protein [Allomuricauda ochracea]NAY93023.1 gluconate 2-dehydrogenase subunit 3 family protein [Allomuricauda ochracea]
MDRRKSIKSLVLGSVAGGLALHGCKPGDEQMEQVVEQAEVFYGRTPEERELDAELQKEQFFNIHEMATLAILCDCILPGSEEYKSAMDAEVPNFIEFMVKDIPEMQVNLRGGLMWLDHQCNARFGAEFISLEQEKQHEILDEIAYYDPDIPEEERPAAVNFFSLLRNLTLTGFYTSKIGIEELGYKGNMPNVWDGVPEDVLKQHGVAYEEEWLAKCIDQSKRNIVAKWDDEGNLIT